MRLTLWACVFSGALSATVWAADECSPRHKDEVTYKVGKMHCDSCSETIGSYFRKQKEVQKAEADFASACLRIEWKDKPMTQKQIGDALTKLGYSLEPSN